MATIGFIPHPNREEAVGLARSTAAWLTAAGHHAPILSGDSSDPAERESARNLDLAVSIGGDGTMLRVVDLVVPFDVPVVGVNVGHLGFLTEVGPAELTEAVERFLAGEFRIEERLMLAIEVRSGPGGGPPRLHSALNDLVIQRAFSGHTVRLAVCLKGTPFLTYASDSMILATPTGSTAYNLSARGPILSPRTRALVLTPVAAHMLFDRSLVLAEDEDVTFEILGDLSAELVVDGQIVGCLPTGTVVHCRAGDHNARFVTFGGYDFHHVLKQKFGPTDR